MTDGPMLAYALTILILVATLIVWIAQYRRMYGRKNRDSSDPPTDLDDPDTRDD